MSSDVTTSAARLLALVKVATEHEFEWHVVADALSESGSVERIYSGEWTGFEPTDAVRLHNVAARVTDELVEHFAALVERVSEEGVSLITVLDDAYPENLREVFNRPPFLFIRGELKPKDVRAVAVVGTREASEAGRRAARRLASELARNGVTVLSGLARGIDTAAHEGALSVTGGRTVAVMGTGINRVYPPGNASLAERIAKSGALVSQFWPDHPPAGYSFPLRNVTMSGMGVGTVVVEASATSGAKMQARLALEHGKRVFLPRSLVESQEWARRYVETRGAEMIESTDDILEVLLSLAQPEAQQLSLG